MMIFYGYVNVYQAGYMLSWDKLGWSDTLNVYIAVEAMAQVEIVDLPN